MTVFRAGKESLLPFCVGFVVMLIQVERRLRGGERFLSMVLLDMVHPLFIFFIFRSREGDGESLQSFVSVQYDISIVIDSCHIDDYRGRVKNTEGDYCCSWFIWVWHVQCE